MLKIYVREKIQQKILFEENKVISLSKSFLKTKELLDFTFSKIRPEDGDFPWIIVIAWFSIRSDVLVIDIFYQFNDFSQRILTPDRVKIYKHGFHLYVI